MAAPSEYQAPGKSQGGGVEGQRRISSRTLTSANLEPIALELLFGPQDSAVSLTNVGGIASAEALGSPVASVVASPAGIATAEAFGEPTVDTSAHVTDAGGIVSAEALGAPALAVTASPSGIASAEALGTPTLPAVVAPAGIASAESVGTPAAAVTASPSGIPSAEAFGEPTVSDAPLAVDLTDVGGITSAESVGEPTVTPAPVVTASGGILRRPVWRDVPPPRRYTETITGSAASTQEPQTTTARGTVRAVVRGQAAARQTPQTTRARAALVFRARAASTQAPMRVARLTGSVETPEDVAWQIIAMIEAARGASESRAREDDPPPPAPVRRARQEVAV